MTTDYLTLPDELRTEQGPPTSPWVTDLLAGKTLFFPTADKRAESSRRSTVYQIAKRENRKARVVQHTHNGVAGVMVWLKPDQG